MSEDLTGQQFPPTTLNIPFKGSRKYVHSTDLWNSVTACFYPAGPPADTRMLMNFRRLATNLPAVLAVETSKREYAFADLLIESPNARKVFVLAETDQPVTGRVECPESWLVPHIVVDTESASLGGQTGASPIEMIVATCKKLHLLSVDDSVKWLATRLNLPISLSIGKDDVIEVRLKRRLSSLATLSEVLVNSEKLGEIAFSPRH